MEIAHSGSFPILTMKIVWNIHRVLELVLFFVSATGFALRPSNSAIFGNPLAKILNIF
jgi:hypothetical protein